MIFVSWEYWGIFSVSGSRGSDLGDGIGVMDAHRLEERGSLSFGGVDAQVKSAQHSQRAARLTIRGEEQLWGISGALNLMVEVWVSGQTDKQTMFKCIHHKRVTDLGEVALWTNRRAKEYILCEVQQTIRGIRLSARRIFRQNHHTRPCSYVVWDHRSLPWASSKHPAGQQREDMMWCMARDM